MHDRRRIDAGRAGLNGQQEIRLRYRLLLDKRLCASPGQPRPDAPESDLQSKSIAGHDLPTELRLVDAAEPDQCRGRRLRTVEQQHRRHLRERLNHQHSRHQRQAREMSLEEFLVDGDVLDCDKPITRPVLGHRVDQEGRITVVEAVQE